MIGKIGFVGIGIMGKPMCRNLMNAGHTLALYDVDPAPVEELAAEGAEKTTSPKQAAENADLIVTMLPDDRIVEEVALGRNGLLEGMNEGAILVDMSTVSPTTARGIAEALEEEGMEMLDAPVSGGEVGAVEGSLSIMVGGRREVFERALPVLRKLGKNVSYVGDHGTGQVAKASNQIIVALTIEAVAEALIFAKKAGADPERVRNALLGGFAQSRVLELHGRRMLDRDFKPGAKVSLHKKDNEIAMAMASDLGMYLPGTALVSHLWNSVAALGGLDWDHAALVRALEAMSGTEVRPGIN